MDQIKEQKEREIPVNKPEKVEKTLKTEKLKEVSKGLNKEIKELGVEEKEGADAGFETRINEAKEMLGEEWGESGSVTPVQQSTKQAAQMVQVKAALKNLPTEVKMKRAVEVTLRKEIRRLNKRINKAVNNPHELNNLISRIRELRHFLYKLATATYDVIKSIYLKVIHGIA